MEISRFLWPRKNLLQWKYQIVLDIGKYPNGKIKLPLVSGNISMEI